MSPTGAPFPARYHRNRIAKVLRELRREKSVLLVGSAPSSIKTRDQSFPYRQDSDFYYLTGCSAPGLVLELNGIRDEAILYCRPPHKLSAIWDGPPDDPKQIARRLGASLRISNSIETEIRESLKGGSILYLQNAPRQESADIARNVLGTPSHLRGLLPARFAHTDTILAPLRARKDTIERGLMRQAARVTCASLFGILPIVRAGMKEQILADQLRAEFASFGAREAFGSIVASGPAASILHYERCSRTLGQNEMVLFDIGAELALYAADLSRVIPVSGTFSKKQAAVYRIVLSAHQAALRRVRAGTKISTLQTLAVEYLTEGLRELGVLRGSTSSLIKKNAYKPFFPHSIGHPLGLDVHDVGFARGDPSARLVDGMVFTIEPGLYFQPDDLTVPAKYRGIGIRIEDDVLVTPNGFQNLSRAIPTAPDDVEAWMRRVRNNRHLSSFQVGVPD